LFAIVFNVLNFNKFSYCHETAATTAFYKMRGKDTTFYSVVWHKCVKNAQKEQQKANII